MLPLAAREGSLSFLNALFTATSAVCVTGLVVVDTATFFTSFGQTVILILIQIGGLGFMTMATGIFLFLGRRITLRDRLVMQESLNQFSLAGLVGLSKTILKLAFSIEGVGVLLLSWCFIPQFGFSEGLFKSVFHAVSAFANAGFDIMPNADSLNAYASDYLVSGTIMLLYILGGVGFVVLLDIHQKKRFRKFSLHTKLVLITTVFLLSGGMFFILLLEWSNPATLGGLQHYAARIMAAFFTAATPRTAGFNVVPTNMLTMSSIFFLIALMFIGASPASTGGGVKTATFGVLVWTVVSTMCGNEEVVLLGRRLPGVILKKSLAIVLLFALLIFIFTLLLTITETASFLEIFFETVSAFATVGLSLGITAELSSLGRILIIIAMFIGRIGPLTMVLVFVHRLQKTMVRYPEENILIG